MKRRVVRIPLSRLSRLSGLSRLSRLSGLSGLSGLFILAMLGSSILTLAPGEAEAGLLARWTERLRYGKVRARQRRQVRRNARQGLRRERRVELWTRIRHFTCSVQRQKVLLDRRGRPALDPVTRESRRLDLAVITPFGRLSTLIEITSRAADKSGQEGKTRRIMKRYRKLYIRDSRGGRGGRGGRGDRGNLVPVRRGFLLPTRIKTIRTH